MKTINLNLKNAINTEVFDRYQSRISKIHDAIYSKSVVERDWLGWLDLPTKLNNDEYKSMQELAKKWKNMRVETVVVIGVGGSYLGAAAGYEWLYATPSIKKPDIELIFSGNNVSAETLVSQLNCVENKHFAINVISKSGKTLETAIAFREFRKLLETKIGAAKAKELIAVTTDAKNGILYEMAKTRGYTRFIIPDDVGGRFSVLSPVGLFPFMCAGLNTENLLKGAQDALREYAHPSLKNNDAYAYALARYILSKREFSLELLISYEPKMRLFQEWWKQLFAESEGKNGRGLFPASSQFSTDLHSLGQFIQDGARILFETTLFAKKPVQDLTLLTDSQNEDKIAYLDGKSLHKVNWAIFEASLQAHHESSNIPNIVIEFEKMDEYNLGYLFQFFMLALTMSAYLLGVNPFNQPAVGVYKANMAKTLSKI
ncbi:glucose-6-phosphate isomerase [Mycoplasmopsis californica]|uniref:Glucose-6-phosphate isomerase n=1 Tax=Mycoplasmopsis californica TaxID=2113 RepID=A0A059XVZ1_9BACT|nr:glucose-6-phosphate isomerase [Mycoplasmopsis californica]AIA29417.1 glucose-6-phosphate isomerase [Mycoplasmopsis californica]